MLGILLAVLWSTVSVKADTLQNTTCIVDNATTNETIYTFSERELNNTRFLRLSRYRGKVVDFYV